MGHISLWPQLAASLCLLLCIGQSCFDSVLAHLLHCKGRSLRSSPGWGNLLHCLWHCMWGKGLRGNNAACLLGSHPISSHFPHFLYVTGTLLAAALVLNPRVGGFAHVLGPCRSFKQTLLRDWQFVHCPTPTGSLFCWCWNPGLRSMAWGWNGLLPTCPS